MNQLRQLFSLPIDDIRRWDFRVALFLIFCIPVFYFYKFFSEESQNFFFIKISTYKSANLFAYHVFSKLLLLAMFSVWFITSRRWWWFLISLPLLMYSEDFFYILAREIGWIKENLLGFNIYGFLIFPFLYFLRVSYQKAFLYANSHESKYDKRNIWLDTIAIWILCFSIPLSCIYMFFNPVYYPLINFKFSYLAPGKNIYNFLYYFFDYIVAIMLLGTWFFSSRRWWFFLIAWPILLHAFQFIDLLREYLNIYLINPRWWYMSSFVLLIIYPLYKIRTYLWWDIFHDQLGKKRGFWSKVFYLLNSMGEYFIVVSSLVVINIFSSEDLLYPLHVITLVFLIIWFLFCRQWWYFLISLPLFWYGLELIKEDVNEGFVLFLIALLAFYPLYRMRKYVYKEVIKNQAVLEKEKVIEEEKINKFSRCILKEELESNEVI